MNAHMTTLVCHPIKVIRVHGMTCTQYCLMKKKISYYYSIIMNVSHKGIELRYNFWIQMENLQHIFLHRSFELLFLKNYDSLEFWSYIPFVALKWWSLFWHCTNISSCAIILFESIISLGYVSLSTYICLGMCLSRHILLHT